ncbi:MAG: type II toxin-antitoxin system prevent-host-death family antitoxin [Tetrasphaera sp.]
MDIGVRELRDGLSRHLAFVRAGHTITVTDHGRPVARIVPVGVPSRLEQLIAEGKVTPAARRKSSRPQPIKTTATVSDLVDKQRR